MKSTALYGAVLFLTRPAGVRVDGPSDRRFLRVLSLTRLWREGCGGRPSKRRGASMQAEKTLYAALTAKRQSSRRPVFFSELVN